MPQTRFKPGDRVRVRQDLDTGILYCMVNGPNIEGVFAASHMVKKFAARVVTIDYIDNWRDYPQAGYRILEDEGDYFWTDGMFEPDPADPDVEPGEEFDISGLEFDSIF